uniref:Uncharacterized protein n=1 Tax=Klebsiella pneumoniae TaxID=573 RepID=A0A8B0STM1_KLEPN|nr:hypothetical protein [Klebsiella pneumoniae]
MINPSFSVADKTEACRGAGCCLLSFSGLDYTECLWQISGFFLVLIHMLLVM